MIKHLKTSNVGPMATMELDFGKRLNILTGDNGLGKSFLLDIVWWVLTRRWPSEINSHLTAGKKALPAKEGDATIGYSFSAKSTGVDDESTYQREWQLWTSRLGRPANPGLVLYAMSDGSFAVWDPHRNYWREEVQDRPAAYVFSPSEVWDGLAVSDSRWLCNGLIRDWASWQKEKGEAFTYLTEALAALSPPFVEKLEPGALTRISLDDVRDMPTIKMPYGQEVPVLHASAGIRRIIALAYFLVWAWEEHNQAAKQRGVPVTTQVTFLIDEVESHLHPSWQLRIIPALLKVIEKLTSTEVQLIAATHSPLIMASLEPLFAPERDAWFDFNLDGDGVTLQRHDFEKHGEAGNWLTSEAFDLQSSRSIEYKKLIDDASALLEAPKPDAGAIRRMQEKLVQALNPKDSFLFNWRAICESKEWLA
ncbi:hypothetical protein FACS1894147_07600 [Spirochaetia bacterium]|nr:hypothetical protein FACS1894147_07600 [Spirochaetia bacterium]